MCDPDHDIPSSTRALARQRGKALAAHTRRFVAFSLVACLLQGSLTAQNLREPKFMAQAGPGFDGIYNLDYDQAERVFLALKEENPQHPAPPLYLGTVP